MSVNALLVSDYGEPGERWTQALRDHANADLRIWPDCGDTAKIQAIIVDTPLGARLTYADLPSLKLICFLGHGVSDVLTDQPVPSSVAVTRLKDSKNKWRMTAYALHAVLDQHMRRRDYDEQQAAQVWCRLDVPDFSAVRILVLGLGAIGAEIAFSLARLGFAVAGWARSPHQSDAYETIVGDAALTKYLERSDFVISVLPETDATINLFDEDRFGSVKKGSYFINIGRGSVLDEVALLNALDQNRLSGATLDVVRNEPPTNANPLWTHPKVCLTPHTGGVVDTEAAIQTVVENIRRLQRGEPFLHLVERDVGY